MGCCVFRDPGIWAASSASAFAGQMNRPSQWIAQMADGMSWRRGSERFPTSLEGRISFDGDASPIDCILSDLSMTGARLGFREAAEIPPEFELQIPEEGACAMVRLVWTRGHEAGVMFTD